MADVDASTIRAIQEGVLAYWNAKGRKSLPWRQTRDPWRILVAEVLLRKTTSTQVIPVYEVLSRLRPVEFLEMDTLELERVLRPLGLHRVRAVQLQKIAEKVVELGESALKDEKVLEQLPGVGRYIRNAIMCFAFDAPVPTLDTNMIRVVTRVLNYVSNRSRPREDRRLWSLAEILVPHDYPREFNWAVLDLGADLCTPRKPKCTECSLAASCAYATTVGAMAEPPS